MIALGEPGAFDHCADLPWYSKDIPNAKFKIGQRVRYHGKFETLRGPWIVIGVSCVEDAIFEYVLRDFPYLVWESEIEEMK